MIVYLPSATIGFSTRVSDSDTLTFHSGWALRVDGEWYRNWHWSPSTGRDGGSHVTIRSPLLRLTAFTLVGAWGLTAGGTSMKEECESYVPCSRRTRWQEMEKAWQICLNNNHLSCSSSLISSGHYCNLSILRFSANIQLLSYEYL